MLLSSNNNFLGKSSFLACGNEEVDAVGMVFHLVGVGAGTGIVVGLEFVE